MLRSLWQYRGFVAGSIRREMRARYAGSMLGALWQILNPLALIAIYAIVFAELMRARLPGVEDRFGYAIFVCSGLLAWNMFSEILLRSQVMFVENANMLKKASFPRSCLPTIVVGSALANFAVVYGVFLALLVVVGRFPGAVTIVALVPLALLVLLGSSLGVLAGTVHVFFRDVGQVLGVMLQLLFWLTPIVYPLAALPGQYAGWVTYNPVTPIVQSLQGIFVHRTAPALESLLPPLVLAVALGAVAWLAFRRQAPYVVDEL